MNLKKIYPAIRDKKVIGHIEEKRGLTFTGSIYFYDGLKKKNSYISDYLNQYFFGFNNKFEMNGGMKEYERIYYQRIRSISIIMNLFLVDILWYKEIILIYEKYN